MIDGHGNEYYRNLVQDFRISQLHALLIFSGQNRSGRKEALQERALQLADLGSKTINLKIVEIAKQNRFRETSASDMQGSIPFLESYSNPYTSPIPDSPVHSSGERTTDRSDRSERSTSSSSNSASTSERTSSPPSSYNQRTSIPRHPDVTLKHLPFFDVHDTLLKPASLQPSNNKRLQEATFSFYLTPSQTSDITNSRVQTEFGRREYRKQIQMRFSLLETSCAQEDNFPSNVSVKVNNKMCPLPRIEGAIKSGTEPKRPSKPVNITALCKLTSTSENVIQVSWAVESSSLFTVSFYLVEQLNFQDLLNRLKEKGERHPDYTKALIKEKLKDNDSEISTTTCKVSLACPLGKMRMRIPCRPSTCDHLQTFDAEQFLQLNQLKPQWTCPVCNKEALYKNLMVDGFFSELLKSDKLRSSELEVVLTEDGSWEPMPTKDEQVENIAGGASSQNVELVPILDDDSDTDYSSTTAPAAQNGANNGNSVMNGGGGVKRPITVGECITLDSDSEDESEAKKFRLDSTQKPPGSPDSDIIILDDD